jgi:hypothetical protein
MIGLWFAAHGEALRFFVLFTGALIESFVVNDVCDEYFFGKTESSDAAQVCLRPCSPCIPFRLRRTFRNLTDSSLSAPQYEELIGGSRYRCVAASNRR